MRKSDSGFSLLEMSVAIAILVVLASIAIPNLQAYSEEAHILGAGKAFEKAFTKVRLTAIKSNAYAAIRFEDCPEGPCYSLYLDRNWNGIASADIARGKDVRIGGPFPLTAGAPGVRIGINPGVSEIPPEAGLLDPDGNPIKFGRARMISFSPLGGATPGTFYLAGEGGRQGAVRVNGGTGRVRLMIWHGHSWREQ